MRHVIHPQAVADAVVRAAAQRPQTVAVLVEPSSAMFLGTRAMSELEDAECPYWVISSHYGSMGHALGGALGVCAATGRRAIVLTGDGSLQLLSPLPAAVKHGCLLALVVLNDSRLGLPFHGAGHLGARRAQATTHLARWNFARVGSPRIGTRRVSRLAKLDGAIAEAVSYDGPFVVDCAIDPSVQPPAGDRFASVAAASAGTRA